MLHQPTGRKGRSPQRQTYLQECHRIVPSSSQTSPTIWGNQCGPDDRDCHTYGEDTPDRRPVQRKEKGGGTSAKGSVLILTCVPLPHLVLPLSGCTCSGTPTKATRTTHTHSPTQSRCVPFSDPHVHKAARSNDTRQECTHSNANTMGPFHHPAKSHQADEKSKGREKEGVHQQRVLC